MKCWLCGKNATTSRNIQSYIFKKEGEWCPDVPSRNKRNYCSECFSKYMNETREENELWLRLKRKRMFETAIDKLEHSNIDFVDYEEAIKTVGQYNIENGDKFDSSYEIIAAIILIQNKIHIKPQFKVGAYQTDFCLDDYHVILEIDGDRHKHNKGRDSVRDEAIKKALGSDWEIIRIPTDYIDMNPSKIIEAIKKVLEFREKKHIDWRNV